MTFDLFWMQVQSTVSTVPPNSAVPATAADSLLSTVRGFADVAMSYAVALAAVGALAMAVLELFKKILNLRAAFHARHFTKWFLNLPEPENADKAAAFHDIMQLSTGAAGGNPRADAPARLPQELIDAWSAPAWKVWNIAHFVAKGAQMAPEEAMFNLESSQMMATLQESVDVALADCSNHSALFDLMTSGAAERDVTRWKAACDRPFDPDLPTNVTRLDREAFARIRQSVMRRFDGFQTYLDMRWGTINQVAANVVGAIIMYLALDGLGGKYAEGALKIVLSLLGGVLSPVAKDLVTALRKVKHS